MRSKDLRRLAREALAGNWWLSVLVALIAGFFGSMVTSGGQVNFNIDLDALQEIFGEIPAFIRIYALVVGSVAGMFSLATFILGGVVQLGYSKYLLKQYERQPLQVSDLFSQFERFGQGFLQAFLRALYVFLWSLLFVIPGIVKSYSYSMTPFIMAENPDMTAKEAINFSKELMDGHKGELFCLEWSFIGWILLNMLTLGIGSLFLNPYMNAAYAAFYRNNVQPKAAFYRNNVQPKAAPVEVITEECAVTEPAEETE